MDVVRNGDSGVDTDEGSPLQEFGGDACGIQHGDEEIPSLPEPPRPKPCPKKFKKPCPARFKLKQPKEESDDEDSTVVVAKKYSSSPSVDSDSSRVTGVSTLSTTTIVSETRELKVVKDEISPETQWEPSLSRSSPRKPTVVSPSTVKIETVPKPGPKSMKTKAGPKSSKPKAGPKSKRQARHDSDEEEDREEIQHSRVNDSNQSDESDSEQNLGRELIKTANTAAELLKAVQGLNKKNIIKIECLNCHKKNVPRVNNEGPMMCKDCRFWDHAFHLSENLCVPGGGDFCFMCAQLDKRAPKKNIEYVNTEDLSGVEFDTSNTEFMREIPSGTYNQWKFFWNYELKDMNIKLGDLVYVKQVKGNNWDMLRVQYLIQDSKGQPWFSGYLLFAMHQIPSVSRVKISQDHKDNYPNQKFVVAANGWVPLKTIHSQCCALYLKDYKKGRPYSFNKQDTFPVIYSFNWDKGLTTEEKKKAIEFIAHPDYKACRSKRSWRDHTREELENLVTTDRTLSPTRGKAEDDDEGSSSKGKRGKAKIKVTPTRSENARMSMSNSSNSTPKRPKAGPKSSKVSSSKRRKNEVPDSGQGDSHSQKSGPSLEGYVGDAFKNSATLPTVQIGVPEPVDEMPFDDFCSFVYENSDPEPGAP